MPHVELPVSVVVLILAITAFDSRPDLCLEQNIEHFSRSNHAGDISRFFRPRVILTTNHLFVYAVIITSNNFNAFGAGKIPATKLQFFF
ncbi:hypothetical protein WI664_14005 [Vibrio cholerae]